MKSFLPHDIKDENRKIIFDIVMQHPELAKVEITKKTAMSFVTVSKIVQYFEQLGILVPTGESRDGSGGLGRKRTVYRFNENRYASIGLQVIGGQITAVLINLHCNVLYTYSIDTGIPFYNEEFIGVFKNIVCRMSEKAEETGSKIVGVGIGVDGAINNRNKTIRMRVQNDKEGDYFFEPIIEKLKMAVGLPIILENDVNASTVAEYRKIEDQENGLEDLIHISLGEGVGAGMILNKKLHRGVHASAGELEYMCFDPDYIKAPHSVGWLEGKLGMRALLNQFDLSLDSGREAFVEYVSKHLALIITNINSLLDVGTIIISGKTALLYPEELLARTQAYVKQFTDWEPFIIVSRSSHSTAVGAANLVLQDRMMEIISG
ncbi:ROK family protein [Neobacillus sp. YIM B06451]|uniref:ROK family protein n=1 Tax=Neobacillus sp. YIM B06451 TaxID=3070994 RepID=UPI00292FCA16|nr:ROK family protein [Neobacillus sp. YIM B06451]